MNGSVVQTWMSDILHAITQGLLVPDIILLIAFIAYALFCIGSILVEFFTERKHFKVAMPKFLAALMEANESEIPQVIEESGLLKRQKVAMLTVYDYRMLPGDALVALIRRLVSEEESRYDRISGRNNMAARVSPMLGLMGTLIPLGPGIQALGTANTELLSASLLIAFDTTVAGLVVAAVCMVIGKIRGNWYSNYMSALDSGMATMLQKIEDMRAEGKIVTKEPSDYAFLFGQAALDVKKDKEAAKAEKKESAKNADDRGSADWRTTTPMSSKAEGSMLPQTASLGASPVTNTIGAGGATSAATATSATSATSAGGSALDALAQLVSDTPSDSAVNAPVVTQEAAMPVVTQEAAMPVGLNTAPEPFVAAAPVAVPAASFASEPVQPLQSSASFAPVPDPAFISDLHAAAAANPAPVAYPAPMPSVEPAFQAPVDNPAPEPAPAIAANPISPLEQAIATAEAVPTRQASEWYQPRLRTDDDAENPYPGTPGDASQVYPTSKDWR